MRPAKACDACRWSPSFPPRAQILTDASSLRRRRCDIAVNGEGCTYCTARGDECSRKDSPVVAVCRPQPIPRARSPAFSGHAAIAEQTTSKLPPKTVCVELTRLYFDFIHDKFHSLFHPPSMIQDVLDDRAPLILLYGILALSARSGIVFAWGAAALTGSRFSKNPFFQGSEARERDRQYSAECKRLLNLDDVSLITVQACVLLGAAAIAEGKPGAESVYYAVACRITQLLDLPNQSTMSPIEKEVNIRGPSPSLSPSTDDLGD
ncbi:hypothetical protein N7474_009718 [Penicillium riverlandense]|uniref:uncharacterized protein n=1 Tax=Penicillium riverlandense TaxID=1903569 RepID=UPI002546B5B1|nr:uncharacterized protein N7474_009718 [Penicillium riverlandense]KAJ5808449.1 hypothetical protein N7474_009718 [Penicillium riverlandense]